MFVRDWRNTPNSHRNQYKADRWFSFEQRSLKRGKLTSFSQPMTSFFSDIWIRRRLFKKSSSIMSFPFYTPCFLAGFLRTRHSTRRTILFPFPLTKMQAAESTSIFQFSILFDVVNIAFDRSVFPISVLYKINAFILSKRHYYGPLQWRTCKLLRYKLLWRIRWEERHLQVFAGPTIERQNCTGVQIKHVQT